MSWASASTLLTDHPQNLPKRTWISPLEGLVGQKPFCWGSFWSLPPPGVRGEAKRKESQGNQESQSSCRGCWWRRGQWLDTRRKHTRGEARRLKGIGEWKREAGDLRERVRADEVKDDWRRGNIQVESAGWKEGKKERKDLWRVKGLSCH